MDGLIRGGDGVQNNLLQQISMLQRRVSELEKVALTSKSAALKYEPLITTDQRKANAWMAMQSMPLLFPNLRGVWLMNQWAPGFIYDLTGQARHMSTNGTIAFQQHTNNLLRYLTLDGSSTYLSRASEAGLEITGSLSVMGWFYKTTAGTTLPLVSKASTLSASTNLAWFLANGSGGNLNMSICSGTTITSATTPAPAGEWIFGVGAYSPPSLGGYVRTYLGTRDGWGVNEVTTGIPASINNPTAVGLTIGALHGGSSFASGNCAMAAIMNSASNETLFRTFFDYTKDAFYL